MDLKFAMLDTICTSMPCDKAGENDFAWFQRVDPFSMAARCIEVQKVHWAPLWRPWILSARQTAFSPPPRGLPPSNNLPPTSIYSTFPPFPPMGFTHRPLPLKTSSTGQPSSQLKPLQWCCIWRYDSSVFASFVCLGFVHLYTDYR